MADGGQIAHDEIAEHGAHVESHRSVERELRIDHPVSLSVTMIDPVWRSPWISVSGLRHEFELEPRYRHMQVEVFAEAGGGRIEPGRCPAVLLGLK